MFGRSNIRLFFPVRIFEEKNAASAENKVYIEFGFFVVFFLLEFSSLSLPHHALIYNWSPPSKPILFAMIFV